MVGLNVAFIAAFYSCPTCRDNGTESLCRMCAYKERRKLIMKVKLHFSLERVPLKY